MMMTMESKSAHLVRNFPLPLVAEMNQEIIRIIFTAREQLIQYEVLSIWGRLLNWDDLKLYKGRKRWFKIPRLV
jgi:hypothetical protein